MFFYCNHDAASVYIAVKSVCPVMAGQELSRVDGAVQFRFADDHDVGVHSVTKCGDFTALSIDAVGIEHSDSDVIALGADHSINRASSVEFGRAAAVANGNVMDIDKSFPLTFAKKDFF